MSSAEVLEENNFYPFGLKYEGYNVQAGNISYNYQYNSKELQRETGWSDYGARMYMADIGRWGVIDPLSETSRRFTPYNYAYNNPISFIDPDGRKAQSPDMLEKNIITKNAPDGSLWFTYANGEHGAGGGDGMGDFFAQMRLSGGGGGGSSTFGETQAYRDIMNAWQNGGTAGLSNIGGILRWWTDFGQEDKGLVGSFNMLKLKSYGDNIDWHATSQGLRKWSGYAFSANKFIFQPAADRALLYGAGEAYSTTNLVFEKALPKILGSRRIYVPLMEVSVKNAQRLAMGTKYAGRVLGGAGILLASGDILSNGANMSNSLDLVMSVLAVSPTGWGQAIAGTYFLANGITTLVTGKDIGQHIEGAVNKYYNDGVRAEEQRRFNAAMGY